MRRVIAVILVFAVVAPFCSYAADGKKHFKEGMKCAASKQADKAAEQFALALAEEPSNMEYQLQYRRAVVNAAIMMVERGDRLAAQKDYNAAYNSYRQAYAYDPTNELASIKMRRMLELQGLPADSSPVSDDSIWPSYRRRNDEASVKAAYSSPPSADAHPRDLPQRRPVTTDVVFRGASLLGAIEQLAQTMRLNVGFEQQVETAMKARPLTLELREVTRAEALEMILQMNGLTYVQVGRRTIMIVSDGPQNNPSNRMRYERMAVRTFYIKNADINEVRTMITTTFGNAKQVTLSKQLNALIVRDTPANLELIESLINSLDKSKAEVLIDVNIYEVSRSDLLRLGNQFSSSDNPKDGTGLAYLGGVSQQKGVVGNAARTLKGPLGLALGLPPSVISFFQDRGKTKLLFSTQVHVLDNEQQQARIGQRVPIKTGSSFLGNVGNIGNTGNTGGNNPNTNPGFTFDNIQYESVGLNIDMHPQVFENEIQMKMKIESSSVDRSTGDLTPSFNQRTISSVARIKDGQTTMIAGISRSEESRRVRGIPLIGLIPILGRFFSTPSTDSHQSDIVITVTPHILRSANIGNDDHLTMDAGKGADTTRQFSIERILYVAEQEESRQNQVAASDQQDKPSMRNNANQAEIRTIAASMPDALALVDSPSPGIVPASAMSNSIMGSAAPALAPKVERKIVESPGIQFDREQDDDEQEATQSSGVVSIAAEALSATPIAGRDFYVAVTVNGDLEISSARISLHFDPSVLEVKSVRDGGLLARGGPSGIEFDAQGGVLSAQIETTRRSSGVMARGRLLLIVFAVKGEGQSRLAFDEQKTVLRSPAGQALPLQFRSAQIETK